MQSGFPNRAVHAELDVTLGWGWRNSAVHRFVWGVLVGEDHLRFYQDNPQLVRGACLGGYKQVSMKQPCKGSKHTVCLVLS